MHMHTFRSVVAMVRGVAAVRAVAVVRAATSRMAAATVAVAVVVVARRAMMWSSMPTRSTR